MENLFAKNFPGLFTTYGDYIVHASRNCMTPLKHLFTSRGDWVLCGAEHLCRVAILNPFEESYLLWRANNLFRESQNSVWGANNKLLCKAYKPNIGSRNYSQMTRHQITFAHNLHNLSSCVFLRITSNKFANNLNAVYEEIVKLHNFIESRQGYF